VDKIGRAIPPELRPLWERRHELQDMVNAVSKLRTTIRAAQDSQDPLFLEMNFSSTLNLADRLYQELAAVVPYCVCPSCQGIGCRACKGRGLMGEFRYDTCVPKKLKGGD